MTIMKTHFKTLLFLSLAVTMSLVLAACTPTASSPPPEASILDDSAKATAGLSIPTDAIKLSECVPNMGEHYANPANLPFGPIYLVDNGKVIGIEYMIHENELEENILDIDGHKTGKPAIMSAFNTKFDHVELNYNPEGHEGDEVAHYDLHMYLVSAEEQAKACQ